MSDTPGTPSLDCTIYVRRYLIKRRSNLGEIALSSGGDKFVSVPDDAIETSHGVVGLRRRPGGLERDVGFVFLKDLHKHSSVMYKNQGISTEPFRVHAHGVALVEANRSGLKYRRGDKFWLFDKHASTVEDGGNLAPVVNLRTGEYGSVVITDVCWYPDVEGDNGELWTVIGGFREIRGGRAGTSIRTIYRVNHRVDATVQAFGQVRIDKDLMPKERRKMLYLGIRKALGDDIEQEGLSCLAQCITPSVPLSPPPTPPLMATASLPVKSWRTSQSLRRVKTEARRCRNAVKHVSKDDGIGRRPNRTATTLTAPTEGLAPSPESVNPRNRVTPRRIRRTRRKVKVAFPRSSPATELDSSVTSFSSGASPSSFISTRASSIQESDRQSSPEIDLEEDYGGIRVLESPEPLDINGRYPQKGCRPYSTYFQESYCRTDSIQLSLNWAPNMFRAQRAFSKTKDGQIDVKVGEIITDVVYSPIIDIRKEYFWRGRNSRGFVGEFPSNVCGYDARYCLPFKNLYDLDKLFPGRCRESRPHRHCLSSLHAVPGVKGRCVLGGRPRTGRPHICCTWSKKDWERANVPPDAEPWFGDRRSKDLPALQRGHGCVVDKSSLAEERLVRHPPGEAEYVMEIIINS